METNDVTYSQPVSLRSESCSLKYTLLFWGILTVFLIVLIAVLTPLSNRLQEKEDRKTAERNYDKYYSEVVDFIAKESEEYRSKNPDGNIRELDSIEKILDLFTLGEYSASDPERFNDEISYIRSRIESHYSAFSFSEAEPERVIGLGIADSKSRSEIIDDLIDAERESRWFGNDNAVASVILIAVILLILIIPACLISVIAAAVLKNRRCVTVTDAGIYFGSSFFVPMSEVTDAKAKGFGRLIVVTPQKKFKRKCIRNNCEIIKFINEHRNNAAQ
ncbi:MAG: hypothetical protein IKO47_02790 [Ruminococcus sp.]|nr:hypothetical protein [Ruminococcus sp.]